MTTNRLLSYYGPGVGVNRMFAGKQRFPNREYHDFKDAMALLFRAQWAGQPMFKKPEHLEVKMHLRVPRAADPHNFCKPILDALEDAGVYENDRMVHRTVIIESSQHAPPKQVGVIVQVWISARIPDITIENRFDKLEVEKR